ncbi:3TM-type holin [Pseudoalteromonas phenolica]|nr:3TM-type holin [Pseudoalteromonas phenolica]
MNWFSQLFASSGEPVKAISNMIDELYTSDDELLELEALKARLQAKQRELQIEVNSIQVNHRSVFVAGARPFLMWVCGLGFLFAFVINPILQWLIPEQGTPMLPLNVMLELTLGMLGLAGLRTIEKIKGVAK